MPNDERLQKITLIYKTPEDNHTAEEQLMMESKEASLGQDLSEESLGESMESPGVDDEEDSQESWKEPQTVRMCMGMTRKNQKCRNRPHGNPKTCLAHCRAVPMPTELELNIPTRGMCGGTCAKYSQARSERARLH
jgi:hypothetical protein